MGLMNKIKKSLELKQNTPSSKSVKLAQENILELKKQFELNPNDPRILIKLYSCYVEISDLDKKNYLSWHYWGKIDALLNDAYGSQSGQRS